MTITIIGYFIAALGGLVLGSFAGATVWRLRARQLVADKAAGEKVSAAELKRLKPLATTKLSTDRSRCLSCKHELQWYDLLPLISWLSTGGTCRYCKQPIGYFEPLMEIGSAGLLVAFYHYWLQLPQVDLWWLFAVWVVVLLLLVIQFAYDTKWFLLPDVIALPLIGLSVIVAGYAVLASNQPPVALISAAAAAGVIGGLYFGLWLVSGGRWVGLGDAKLGVALGLLLSDWRLALIALFLANLIGTIIVIPGMLTGKLSRKAHVPFGPLLIAGFFVTLFFGTQLLDWYLKLTYLAI